MTGMLFLSKSKKKFEYVKWRNKNYKVGDLLKIRRFAERFWSQIQEIKSVQK